MAESRRRFAGLRDLIHDNVRQGLTAGLTALGVKPGKQLIDDEPIITLQCGKVVMENTPRKMRTELWLSSLHRKGVGVAAAARYEDMLMHKSVTDEAASDIEKDLARTFPSMRRFAGQEGQQALRRVLLAYAAYDPEVGYCQGMNFVAGLLLMYLPERHAFGGLVVMMQDRGLRKYYSTDMSLLQTHLWQLGRLMPQKLCAHLEACGVLPLLYGASWLMTCFSADFPASFSARVMDVIMADKMDQALLKAAVGLLKRCEKQLMQMSDMEDILQLLKLQLPNWEEPVLQDTLTDIFRTPWSPQQLQLLGSVEGAESVAEALARVHKANSQAAAGTDSVSEATTPTAPTAATPTGHGRLSAVGFDSVDGASDGGGSSIGGATAIRLIPPPTPRSLSRAVTPRGFSVRDVDIATADQGSLQGAADVLEHTEHAAATAGAVGSSPVVEAGPGTRGNGVTAGAHVATPVRTHKEQPAAASNGVLPVDLLLIDMSSPRASLERPIAADAGPVDAAAASEPNDWAAFIGSPAAEQAAGVTAVQPVTGWDPFDIEGPQPRHGSSRIHTSTSRDHALVAPPAGALFSSNADTFNSYGAPQQQQAQALQLHHQPEQQLQQQVGHRHQLRAQLEELSFSQLSSSQSPHLVQQIQQQHVHPGMQQQHQHHSHIPHWQPAVRQQQQSGSKSKPVLAPAPNQAADDDWWDFESSPLACGHGCKP